MIRFLSAFLLSAFALSAPAAAQPPCGPGYGAPRVLDLDAGEAPLTDHLEGQGVVLRKRGLVNSSIVTQAGRPVLVVNYPQGSVNPGNKASPLGGDEFFWPGYAVDGVERACLTYRVRFETEFDFNRGGKLPGLYGTLNGAITTMASGCRRASDGKDFSTRLMWRRGGAGEVYAYAANRPGPCGWSLGRGNWNFQPGQWTDITQEIILNAPGRTDGIIRLWIGGALMLEKSNIKFRDTEQTTLRGLFFSTFFGGNDASWASPRTQSAEFTDFRLFAPN